MRSFNAKCILLPKIILLTLTIAGCNDFKDEPKKSIDEISKTDRVNPTTPVIKKLSEAKFLLTETPLPHEYQIEISWNENIKNLLIRDGDKIMNQGERKSPFIIFLKDNSEYKIEVFSMDENPIKSIGKFDGISPKDVSLGGFSLTQNKEIKANRIFIDNKEIFLNGFTLNLEANEVVAADSKMTSYLAGPIHAPQGSHGRGGGNFILKSKKASGLININLFGLGGGQGNEGPFYPGRGTKGYRGERAQASGGGGGCACTKQPTNGTPGGVGAKGFTGEKGFNGGDSGFYKIEVIEKGSFNVYSTINAGQSGIGGLGGKGQQGGEGGDPGENPNFTYCSCNSAQKGPDGPNGPRGDEGPPGEPGKIQESCLSIGKGSGICFKEMCHYF